MIYRYIHPELFADWETPDWDKYNGQFVLYGAGRRGAVAAHALKKRGVAFICFCDSDSALWGKTYCGHPVISPGQLRDQYHDKPILITTNHYYYLYDRLTQEGFSPVYSSVALFLEIDFENFSEGYSVEYMSRNTDQYFNSLLDGRVTKNKYLPDLMFLTTTRCTLRCKECTSYIPYVSKAEDFDENIIVRTMDKLLTAYTAVGNVSLYGGEPLLYKPLARLIKAFDSRPQIELITVITNGTLLPDEELLQAMRSPKVRIRISDYGALSKRLDSLTSLLSDNSVKYELTRFGRWNLAPTVDILNESDEELREKVRNCCTVAKMPLCINGKMFFCGFSGYFDYFKAVPDFGDNYIHLLEFDGTGEALRRAIDEKFSMAIDGLPKQTCRFCKFNHLEQNLPVAEQTAQLRRFKKVW